jgi:hypothetical protein
MIRFELLWRDGYFGTLPFGLEDGLGQCDVPGDAFEELLRLFDGFAVGILSEVPGR